MYSSDIADLLTSQLARFVTLNRHQLAGQVANLAFWLAEVRHCLEVIDGYEARFERLKAAQMNHAAKHGTAEFLLHDPCCTKQAAAPPRRAPDSGLKGSRRSLCDATYRFLVRCFHEGLIGESGLRSDCDSLGISVEAGDLRSHA